MSAEISLQTLPVAIRSELQQKGAVSGVVSNRLSAVGQEPVQEIRIGNAVIRVNPPLPLRDGERVTLRLDVAAGTVRIESRGQGDAISLPTAAPLSGAGRARHALQTLTEALRGTLSRVRGSAVDSEAERWLQQNGAQVLEAGDFARRERVAAKIAALLGASPREVVRGSDGQGGAERTLLQLVSEKLLYQAVKRGLSEAVQSVRTLMMGPDKKPVEQQIKGSALGNLAAALSEAGLAKVTSEELLRRGLKQTLSGTAQEVERLRERAASISVQSSALEDFRKLLQTLQAQLRSPASEGDRVLLDIIKRLDNALARFERQTLGDEHAEIRDTLRSALKELDPLVKGAGISQNTGDSALSPPFMRAARQLQAMLQLLAELPDEALLENIQVFGKGALSLLSLKGEIATAADRELFEAVREFDRRIADSRGKPNAVRADARGLLETVTRVLEGSKSAAATGGIGIRSPVLGAQLQDAIGRLIEGRFVTPSISVREIGASPQSFERIGPEGRLSNLGIDPAQPDATGEDGFINSATVIREYQRVGIRQVVMEGHESLHGFLREMLRDPQTGQIIKLLTRLSGVELLSLPESERGLVTELQRLVAPLRADVDGVAQNSSIPKAELKRVIGEIKDALALQRATDAIPRNEGAARFSIDRVRGILEGQVVLNQMAPAMQLKGEAMAILLPSFLGGMFGSVQIKRSIDGDLGSAASGKRWGADDGEAGREPYRRLEITVTFPTLGPIDMCLAYRSRELSAQLRCGDSEAAVCIAGRVGALEGTLRMMGYQKVSIEVVERRGERTSEAAKESGPYSAIERRDEPRLGQVGIQLRGTV